MAPCGFPAALALGLANMGLVAAALGVCATGVIKRLSRASKSAEDTGGGGSVPSVVFTVGMPVIGASGVFSDTKDLQEVVVIGYGTAKKNEVTSSISSVGEKDIKNLPVPGVDQALQGKVAGVNVTSNGGQPGGGISVRVRGITSVNGNEPLYVIDGVPILTGRSSISQDQLGGMAGQSVQSPLAALNANDIVSIDILKDASAQAIYGETSGREG